MSDDENVLKDIVLFVLLPFIAVVYVLARWCREHV